MKNQTKILMIIAAVLGVACILVGMIGMAYQAVVVDITADAGEVMAAIAEAVAVARQSHRLKSSRVRIRHRSRPTSLWLKA